MINWDKLEKARERYQEIEGLLSDARIIEDKAQYQKLAKEFASLTVLQEASREYDHLVQQLSDLEKLLIEKHDKDFEDMIKAEQRELKERQEKLLSRLDELQNPRQELENAALIIEIRAGTGGEEASLFAAELYRMYTRFAQRQGWECETMGSHPSESGGFKEVALSISGPGAARRLRYESGAHRVQRVPVTEASGRIHTSAATVAVLEEPKEVEIAIDPKDLKIDVFRSSGPGGQSVNTTDSAIRITHLPTSTVVVCQDERSQLKNRMKAMRVLRARIMDKIRQDNIAKTTQDRKSQIGSGDRSEKIRTYNFPDHRITDHRVGFTSHKMDAILDGDLGELTDALITAQEKLDAGIEA